MSVLYSITNNTHPLLDDRSYDLLLHTLLFDNICGHMLYSVNASYNCDTAKRLKYLCFIFTNDYLYLFKVKPFNTIDNEGKIQCDFKLKKLYQRIKRILFTVYFFKDQPNCFSLRPITTKSSSETSGVFNRKVKQFFFIVYTIASQSQYQLFKGFYNTHLNPNLHNLPLIKARIESLSMCMPKEDFIKDALDQLEFTKSVQHKSKVTALSLDAPTNQTAQPNAHRHYYSILRYILTLLGSTVPSISPIFGTHLQSLRRALQFIERGPVPVTSGLEVVHLNGLKCAVVAMRYCFASLDSIEGSLQGIVEANKSLYNQQLSFTRALLLNDDIPSKEHGVMHIVHMHYRHIYAAYRLSAQLGTLVNQLISNNLMGYGAPGELKLSVATSLRFNFNSRIKKLVEQWSQLSRAIYTHYFTCVLNVLPVAVALAEWHRALLHCKPASPGGKIMDIIHSIAIKYKQLLQVYVPPHYTDSVNVHQTLCWVSNGLERYLRNTNCFITVYRHLSLNLGGISQKLGLCAELQKCSYDQYLTMRNNISHLYFKRIDAALVTEPCKLTELFLWCHGSCVLDAKISFNCNPSSSVQAGVHCLPHFSNVTDFLVVAMRHLNHINAPNLAMALVHLFSLKKGLESHTRSSKVGKGHIIVELSAQLAETLLRIDTYLYKYGTLAIQAKNAYLGKHHPCICKWKIHANIDLNSVYDQHYKTYLEYIPNNSHIDSSVLKQIETNYPFLSTSTSFQSEYSFKVPLTRLILLGLSDVSFEEGSTSSTNSTHFLTNLSTLLLSCKQIQHYIDSTLSVYNLLVEHRELLAFNDSNASMSEIDVLTEQYINQVLSNFFQLVDVNLNINTVSSQSTSFSVFKEPSIVSTCNSLFQSIVLLLLVEYNEGRLAYKKRSPYKACFISIGKCKSKRWSNPNVRPNSKFKTYINQCIIPCIEYNVRELVGAIVHSLKHHFNVIFSISYWNEVKEKGIFNYTEGIHQLINTAICDMLILLYKYIFPRLNVDLVYAIMNGTLQQLESALSHDFTTSFQPSELTSIKFSHTDPDVIDVETESIFSHSSMDIRFGSGHYTESCDSLGSMSSADYAVLHHLHSYLDQKLSGAKSKSVFKLLGRTGKVKSESDPSGLYLNFKVTPKLKQLVYSFFKEYQRKLSTMNLSLLTILNTFFTMSTDVYMPDNTILIPVDVILLRLAHHADTPVSSKQSLYSVFNAIQIHMNTAYQVFLNTMHQVDSSTHCKEPPAGYTSLQKFTFPSHSDVHCVFQSIGNLEASVAKLSAGATKLLVDNEGKEVNLRQLQC